MREDDESEYESEDPIDHDDADDPYGMDNSDDLSEGLEEAADAVPYDDDPLEALSQASAGHHAERYPMPGPGGPARFQPPVDVTGALDDDISCRGCGYNLRGQSPEGSCPECGAAVADALVSDRLRFADKAWLGQMRRGATVISTGTVVLIIFYILLVVGVVFVAISSPSSFSGGASAGGASMVGLQMAFGLLGGLAQLGVIGYGYWLMTTPEPGKDPGGPRSRLLARWLTPVGIIVVTALNIVGAAVTSRPAAIGLGSLGVIFNLVYAIGLVALLFYIPTLAQRVPNFGLAKQTRILAWCSIATVGVAIPLGLGLAVTTPATGGGPGAMAGPFMILSFIACFLVPLALGLFVWGLVVMFLYRGMFDRAYKSAARTRA